MKYRQMVHIITEKQVERGEEEEEDETYVPGYNLKRWERSKKRFCEFGNWNYNTETEEEEKEEERSGFWDGSYVLIREKESWKWHALTNHFHIFRRDIEL